MQESPAQSPLSRSGVAPASSQSLQTATTMAFTTDLMLGSELYPAGTESFLYEDQFMQDLPW